MKEDSHFSHNIPIWTNQPSHWNQPEKMIVKKNQPEGTGRTKKRVSPWIRATSPYGHSLISKLEMRSEGLRNWVVLHSEETKKWNTGPSLWPETPKTRCKSELVEDRPFRGLNFSLGVNYLNTWIRIQLVVDF